MEKQDCRRRRVVLVPCPFQGHINPILQLGTILHSKGFSITVAHTQFKFPDTCKHPDFLFIPLSLSEGSSNSSNFPDNILAFMSFLNLNCRAPLQEVLIRIIEEQDQHDKLPCVVYDGLMYFAEAVACNLKLPSIMLRTSGATNLLSYYAYPRLQEEDTISNT
ncbi:hypothetical protein Pint_32701 [Pistacia integerrima]|uniref:Uncharacterized protein n=2 Tax=Pistacia integerrima TaxID=434235 RepID=A0ACC0XRD8_9ROSI|nr:hypothetical protein Pint_32710 [Pistacia integerrima]KAJ0020882.1 hypothetical protein Pint_32701 [Pistacia integerrima]